MADAAAQSKAAGDGTTSSGAVAAAVAQAQQASLDADSFARFVVRQAISRHLAENGEVEAVEASALEVLVDLAQRYTEELGVVAQSLAESAGRVQSNADDVSRALSDVHSRPEKQELNVLTLFFTHAVSANARHLPDIPASSQGPLNVPRFPLERPAKMRKVLTSQGPRPQHVPDHLPPYPDLHAYQATSVNVVSDQKQQQGTAASASDRQARVLRKDQEKQQAESNLSSMLSRQAQLPGANYEAQRFVDASASAAAVQNIPAKPPVTVPPTPVQQAALKPLLAKHPNATPSGSGGRDVDDPRVTAILGLSQTGGDGETVTHLTSSRRREAADDAMDEDD